MFFYICSGTRLSNTRRSAVIGIAGRRATRPGRPPRCPAQRVRQPDARRPPRRQLRGRYAPLLKLYVLSDTLTQHLSF